MDLQLKMSQHGKLARRMTEGHSENFSFNESLGDFVEVNTSYMTVDATDLRMNDAYVFWYNNLAKLIITGLAPFLMLCVFNFKIYNALRMRRLIMGPNATAAHQQQLNEDNRQALVLFSIVIIFLISNVPRIALNLHEVSSNVETSLGKSRRNVD